MTQTKSKQTDLPKNFKLLDNGGKVTMWGFSLVVLLSYMYYFVAHDVLTQYLNPCGLLLADRVDPITGWCLGESFAATLPHNPCNVPRVPFSTLFEAGATLPVAPTIFTNVSSSSATGERWRRSALLLDTERSNTKVQAGDPWLLTKQLFTGKRRREVITTTIQEHVLNMRRSRSTPEPQYVFSRLSPNKTFNFLSSDVHLPSLLSGKLWTKLTLALGSSGSGMPFHDHDHSWLVLWHGKKRWFIFDHRNGVKLPARMTNVEFAKTTYQSEDFQRFWKTAGWECTQEENEMMFLPTNLIHAVINIGETVAVVGERCPSSELREDTLLECESTWPSDIGHRLPVQKLQTI
jgi:hypothetical protein